MDDKEFYTEFNLAYNNLASNQAAGLDRVEISTYLSKAQNVLEDALYAASVLGVSFDRFTVEDFLEGINIELEHGRVNPITNVTNDDLIMTSKIALGHLNEFPNYYNKDYGLKQFEEFLLMNLKK